MSESLNVVIVGGGTAGWMFAATLARQCKKFIQVTLIESDDIGTVGVGEATLPQMKTFNDLMGINEREFMKATKATFKLGIEFVNWGENGTSYLHPFGTYGAKPGAIDFLQQWLCANKEGEASPLDKYSYAIQACEKNRFEFPSKDFKDIHSTYTYAYHFDAGLYVDFLRSKFQGKGVRRIEGMIDEVQLNSENGNIESLKLESGQSIKGDYFIDCSGFRSLILGEALKVPFNDWSHWLPCDSALAVPTEIAGPLTPYTRSTAQVVGWQWRIPLQHRLGNGYVYCSDFIDHERALDTLHSNLEGKILQDAKLLKFKTGYRKQSWYKNCIAAGLSSGFLEPLESTSLYLIQVAILNFLEYLPGKEADQSLIKAFNNAVEREYTRARDFLILHYKLNSRSDSEFWRHCSEMPVPDTLIDSMKLFEKRGFVDTYKFGPFQPVSWISVLMGQGGLPRAYNPLADAIPLPRIQEKFQVLKGEIDSRVEQMPDHGEFLAEYCGLSHD